MAKPRVFISSTHFDLKHIRASLEIFVQTLGYEAILSERGNIPYTPDVPLDESCYREVANSDIYVLIVGGRYGSEASESKTSSAKDFYDFYESITRKEHQAAVGAGIPIYILIERSVYSELQTFRKNRENENITYAHVDSVNIFRFIEEILALPRNNPIEQFDRYADIERWLREQWSGYFRELLHQNTNQEQIRSLSAQVETLAAQVGMLSEVNETLRRYLEQVVTKVSPDESKKLIETESERLIEAAHERLERSFPNLSKSVYQIIGPPDSSYNSVSFAAGDVTRWWSPKKYWPKGLPRDTSPETYISLFESLGYQPCDNADLEPGFEKVAFFQDPDGRVSRVSKQAESGSWITKIGTKELIEHMDLDALTSEKYGEVTQLLKRRISSAKTKDRTPTANDTAPPRKSQSARLKASRDG